MLTPMMLGVTVTSIVAGQVTTRTGRYKIFPILGGAIMGVGMYLLTGLDVGTTKPTPAAVVIFVLAWFIKEVPLRGRASPPGADEAPSQQAELVS